jgi:hypothetical protein
MHPAARADSTVDEARRRLRRAMNRRLLGEQMRWQQVRELPGVRDMYAQAEIPLAVREALGDALYRTFEEDACEPSDATASAPGAGPDVRQAKLAHLRVLAESQHAHGSAERADLLAWHEQVQEDPLYNYFMLVGMVKLELLAYKEHIATTGGGATLPAPAKLAPPLAVAAPVAARSLAPAVAAKPKPRSLVDQVRSVHFELQDGLPYVSPLPIPTVTPTAALTHLPWLRPLSDKQLAAPPPPPQQQQPIWERADDEVFVADEDRRAWEALAREKAAEEAAAPVVVLDASKGTFCIEDRRPLVFGTRGAPVAATAAGGYPGPGQWAQKQAQPPINRAAS